MPDLFTAAGVSPEALARAARGKAVRQHKHNWLHGRGLPRDLRALLRLMGETRRDDEDAEALLERLYAE